MSKSMTKADVSRIQSATAKSYGGSVPKGSFAARAQAATASNSRPPNGPSTTPNPSGGGRGNNPPRK